MKTHYRGFQQTFASGLSENRRWFQLGSHMKLPWFHCRVSRKSGVSTNIIVSHATRGLTIEPHVSPIVWMCSKTETATHPELINFITRFPGSRGRTLTSAPRRDIAWLHVPCSFCSPFSIGFWLTGAGIRGTTLGENLNDLDMARAMALSWTHFQLGAMKSSYQVAIYPISWTQFAQSQKANLGRSVKLLCHTFFTHLAYPVMELRQNTEFIHPSSSASELNKRAAGAKPENSVGPASYAGFPSGNIWKATPKKMPNSYEKLEVCGKHHLESRIYTIYTILETLFYPFGAW